MNAVHEHEVKLNRIMTDGVKDLSGVSIIGPKTQPAWWNLFLLMDGLPAHDVAFSLMKQQA